MEETIERFSVKNLEEGTQVGNLTVLGRVSDTVYIMDRGLVMKITEKSVALSKDAREKWLSEYEIGGRLYLIDPKRFAATYSRFLLDIGRAKSRGAILMQRCSPLLESDFTEERLMDIAWCLALMHQKGIVHNDVKLANVMLLPNGRATLIDFGNSEASEYGIDVRSDENGFYNIVKKYVRATGKFIPEASIYETLQYLVQRYHSRM